VENSPAVKVARLQEFGQGLVEAALFLPIFAILMAGLIEVSQIVVAQNRVSNAARTGARFAATGGEDAGMVDVTLNSITQTLDQDESVWDMWSIRGTVNSQGNGFTEWHFKHIYGISSTVRFPEFDESGIQLEVLTELQTDLEGQEPAIAAGLRIVGTYVTHDLDSLLGLDAIPWLANTNSVKALSVMRMVGFGNDATRGCDAFPIAIHKDIRSSTPPGQGPDPFPLAKDFGAGSPEPEYSDFVNHQPHVWLKDAKEGYVFQIENGFGSGNFGWLRWNSGQPDSEGTLKASLTWPGNSRDYTPAESGQEVGELGRVLGFVDAQDFSDTTMSITDYVAAHTGTVNSEGILDRLLDHIEKNRVLRLIIWDQAIDQGNYGEYRIYGFARFRLHGFNLSDNWILAEFIGWDDSCGQT
jgi:hypothetical protein